jgi:hypothetical protein
LVAGITPSDRAEPSAPLLEVRFMVLATEMENANSQTSIFNTT